MANYIASLYSLQYSAKKAKEGNILRHVSTIGHTAKVIQKLAKDDSFVLGKVAKATCDTLSEASKDNKLLEIAGKGIKIAKYTDPISCLCAMIRVGKSDTPGRSFLEETTSLLGMFLVEGLMIKHSKAIGNIQGLKQLNDGMKNLCGKSKFTSQVPAIVYGTLFTVVSDIGSKTFGKVGKWIADKLNLPESKKEEQPKEEKPKKHYYWG